MSLDVGQVFAGYTILRVLGAGGMGTVYLATHPRLPREDALKVLPAEFANDAEYRARFTREADLAAGLSHPHIVGVQDRGEFDGQFWISMDYVAGTDASRLLKDRYPSGMPADEVLTIIDAVAAALDYAHELGLLHRDVKPANILLAEADGQDRRVYLADFGVARRIDDSAGLTETNVAVGTVAYAAPEQLRGDPVDGRADQYALACTAFHLLTGAPPYPDANAAVVITHHLYAPPPSLGSSDDELSKLDPVFMRAMAKQPSDRFATCSEFAAQLRRHSEAAPRINAPDHLVTAPIERPPRKSPRALIAALVAVVLLIGGGVFTGVKLMHRPAAVASTHTTSATTSTAPASTPTTTSAAPLTPGPLNGRYKADFGAATDLDGNGHGAGPATVSYGLRSACRGAECVATAESLGRPNDLAKTMVFDEVGGRWLAVALITDECLSSKSEFWLAFSLQLGPDGTLSGEMTRTSVTNCRDKRPVTLTRTGDLDVDTVADPATVTPRVASPAEALHGRYQVLRTYSAPIPTQPADSAVVTDCLRTGERCMSYFHGAAGDQPLVYQNGTWALTANADYPCPKGGTLHFSVIAEFPLPQPPQNPIERLTGHGRQEQTGLCGVNAAFDQTFTRTGD